MSKTGMACYRDGGCGPYEMYSCSECPASKSDYVQFKTKPKSITNYDIIVRKTPYELAEWFAKTFGDERDFNMWMKFLCASADKEEDLTHDGWLDYN